MSHFRLSISENTVITAAGSRAESARCSGSSRRQALSISFEHVAKSSQKGRAPSTGSRPATSLIHA